MLRCKETDEPFVKRDGKFFPTPHGQLELIDEDGEVAVIYWDRTVRMNSRDDAFAKAERICRAVNLHEELVEACATMRLWLKRVKLADVFPDKMTGTEFGLLVEAVEFADSVLAKARKGVSA